MDALIVFDRLTRRRNLIVGLALTIIAAVQIIAGAASAFATTPAAAMRQEMAMNVIRVLDVVGMWDEQLPVGVEVLHTITENGTSQVLGHLILPIDYYTQGGNLRRQQLLSLEQISLFEPSSNNGNSSLVLKFPVVAKVTSFFGLLDTAVMYGPAIAAPPGYVTENDDAKWVGTLNPHVTYVPPILARATAILYRPSFMWFSLAVLLIGGIWALLAEESITTYTLLTGIALTGALVALRGPLATAMIG